MLNSYCIFLISFTGGIMQIFSGHYLKSADKPNDVTIECENHGCDTTCKFFNGTKTVIENMYSPIHNQPYKLTTISSICLRINDVGRRREEIYSKADQAAEDVPFTFGGSLIASSAKKRDVFNKIVEEEYINASCPFYSK